jgi:endonuclease/exonuclease/phosphatase family metal-dependent hydrolase
MLTVLTYNVWHGRYRTEREEKLRLPAETRELGERRLELQIDQLSTRPADLLLLQEVHPTPRKSKRYGRAFGFSEIHKVSSCGLRLFGFGVPVNLQSGLAVLARRELHLRYFGSARLSGRRSFCTDWLGFQLEEGRYALLASVTLPGGESLLVVNTHLHNPVEISPALAEGLEGMMATGRVSDKQKAAIEKRAKESRERKDREIANLLRLVGRVRRTIPALAGAVIGGDFNARPDSVWMERLRRSGFHDAATKARRGGPQPTYDAAKNPLAKRVYEVSGPGIPTFGSTELLELVRQTRDRQPKRIDYVLVSSDLAGRVRSVELFGTRVGEANPSEDSGFTFPLVGSDHFGVQVELDLESWP